MPTTLRGVLCLAGGATLIALSGCGASDPDAQLPVAVPGQPITLRMASRIEAGHETERCRFFQAPPDGAWIGRAETAYTAGSHHVLLFATRYPHIPTVDRNGHDHDTHGVFDCADGAPADWDVSGVLGGAQSADAPPVELPAGVAVHVPGNAVVLMNTHYLNAAPQPLDTEARITVWPVDPATVTDEAGVLFFYNFWIAVPPRGEAEARMRCPIRRDLTLLDAQSHMHARGVGFDASLLRADGSSLPLYTSQSWENVPVTSFAPGQPLPAGSAIDYRCRYHNDEERLVVQGLTTRDEMCMFIGVYWPRDPVTERCALDSDFFTSDFAATHVGRGNASCAASLDCFDAATADDKGAGFAACIDASCPAQAELLWRAQRCRIQHGEHPETDCADELTACRSKTACN